MTTRLSGDAMWASSSDADAHDAEAKDREVLCGRCGKRYRASAWTALPAVLQLTTADVHEHVTVWPEGRTVMVRACHACGRTMARTFQQAQ